VVWVAGCWLLVCSPLQGFAFELVVVLFWGDFKGCTETGIQLTKTSDLTQPITHSDRGESYS
jgi:hypothetical protein